MEGGDSSCASREQIRSRFQSLRSRVMSATAGSPEEAGLIDGLTRSVEELQSFVESAMRPASAAREQPPVRLPQGTGEIALASAVLDSVDDFFEVIDGPAGSPRPVNASARASGVAQLVMRNGAEHPVQVAFRTGRVEYGEAMRLGTDGRARQVELRAHPVLDEHGCARQVVLHSVDITARRRAESMLLQTRDLIVFALARLTESRDPETGAHLERMRAYSMLLAEELSRSGPFAELIDQAFLDDLYRASPLHDIGKVGIPDVVLLKPGQYNDEEFEIMKQHTVIGAEALAKVCGASSAGGFLQMAVEIARSHHERFDGSGYPDGLVGEEIPLAARIVAVADVYDALTSERVYKRAYEPLAARTMIEQAAGKHFDPEIVRAFLAKWEEFLSICRGFDRESAA